MAFSHPPVTLEMASVVGQAFWIGSVAIGYSLPLRPHLLLIGH